MRWGLFVFLSLLFVQSQGFAADDEQMSAIKRLGQLNGVALQCKALPETQRMKRLLVLNLPKRRQLGELFDLESNASFMRFIEDKAVCPSPETLRKQVDEAIAVLEKVFAKK